MDIKTLNEVYKLGDKELIDYEHGLFVHHALVRDERRRRHLLPKR
jgi:hypothetical protein